MPLIFKMKESGVIQREWLKLFINNVVWLCGHPSPAGAQTGKRFFFSTCLSVCDRIVHGLRLCLSCFVFCFFYSFDKNICKQNPFVC